MKNWTNACCLTAANYCGISRAIYRNRLHSPKMENHFWAMQAVLARPARSFLTGLGVIIGVTAVTMMSTAIRSVETVFDRSMKMLGSDVLYVEQAPWSAPDDFWEYKNRPDI